MHRLFYQTCKRFQNARKQSSLTRMLCSFQERLSRRACHARTHNGLAFFCYPLQHTRPVSEKGHQRMRLRCSTSFFSFWEAPFWLVFCFKCCRCCFPSDMKRKKKKKNKTGNATHPWHVHTETCRKTDLAYGNLWGADEQETWRGEKTGAFCCRCCLRRRTMLPLATTAKSRIRGASPWHGETANLSSVTLLFFSSFKQRKIPISALVVWLSHGLCHWGSYPQRKQVTLPGASGRKETKTYLPKMMSKQKKKSEGTKHNTNNNSLSLHTFCPSDTNSIQTKLLFV